MNCFARLIGAVFTFFSAIWIYVIVGAILMSIWNFILGLF